jgi:hydroxyacylglutathione hydrolase
MPVITHSRRRITAVNLLRWIAIRTANSNAYLILNGTRSALIDTGTPGKAGLILEAARQAEISPSDIKLIVLTHTHFDHAGGLAELKAATGARVVVHASERDYLCMGRSPMPGGTNFLAKIVSLLGRTIFSSISRTPSMEADLLVEQQLDLHEYGLPGLILHTPGHSCGSQTLILQDRIAFAGDTLFGLFKSTAFPPFADHVPTLLESWQLLLATGCDTFLPGHGRSVSRSLLEKTLSKHLPRTRLE